MNRNGLNHPLLTQNEGTAGGDAKISARKSFMLLISNTRTKLKLETK